MLLLWLHGVVGDLACWQATAAKGRWIVPEGKLLLKATIVAPSCEGQSWAVALWQDSPRAAARACELCLHLIGPDKHDRLTSAHLQAKLK